MHEPIKTAEEYRSGFAVNAVNIPFITLGMDFGFSTNDNKIRLA